MIAPVSWTQREFSLDQPIGVFPGVLERLRGTPARAAELVAGVSEEALSKRVNGKWSAKEHLGHLFDLEALDQRRLDEFLNGVPTLPSADTENRTTENADHPQTPIEVILRRLREGRNRLIEKMELLTEHEVASVAIHPRLRKPMRLLDWAYFVAEHDDHHLAQARKAIREQSL
jgi:hypothetical protein